jgi:hypothetical protein
MPGTKANPSPVPVAFMKSFLSIEVVYWKVTLPLSDIGLEKYSIPLEFQKYQPFLTIDGVWPVFLL